MISTRPDVFQTHPTSNPELVMAVAVDVCEFFKGVISTKINKEGNNKTGVGADSFDTVGGRMSSQKAKQIQAKLEAGEDETSLCPGCPC